MTCSCRMLLYFAAVVVCVGANICLAGSPEPLRTAAGAGSSTTIAWPSELLAFEKNEGQHDKTIAFVGRAANYSVLVHKQGVTIAAPMSSNRGE